ncbi:MAG: Uma2 family endonuclease [Pirellulales bacterium]|nr:Uma2 family endonuclease [Pirellulales bacterium]
MVLATEWNGIDLESDPPPDLALEVDATSPSTPGDYEPLRVPELWIYREEAIVINVFDGQHYRESSDSPTFPGIPVRELIPEAVRRAWQAGSSVAVRHFENVLQEL